MSFSAIGRLGRNVGAAALSVILLQASPAFSEDGSRDPDWAEAVPLAEAENFYKINADLYRAAQPSKEAFKHYEALGIRTIVNLRANHSDVDEIEGTSLVLMEIPINTWKITDADVVAALRAIKSAEKPVLVHCQHGADRTGTIIAMARMVFQGWTKEQALAELVKGGYGFHRIWVNIPRYIENVDVEAIRKQVDAKRPE